MALYIISVSIFQIGVGLQASWGRRLWPLKAHCYATVIHILKL